MNMTATDTKGNHMTQTSFAHAAMPTLDAGAMLALIAVERRTSLTDRRAHDRGTIARRAADAARDAARSREEHARRLADRERYAANARARRAQGF